eukprot:13633013-Alexandrium_andersonii.AAC.1
MGELRAALDRVKKGKASGPDGTPPELYKWMGERALKSLLEKSNEYTARKEFPTTWTEADV